ncbi:MAG TPA: RNA polymerase subunit sigma-70 [Porphyromonadaceae bacterium]|nr:RNA polymerase subunit sigma-70 [Porphyromonadaceae bacterium]HBB02052.1 RNA polymerase subunit sigma-70 [Porphyromonadaceae bacterium]HCC17857.1 RNA polymerase subunit sigma-70 [Porphyromonadaceae bacterium]
MFELCKKEKQMVFFGELYRRYIPMVYGLCLKYLANRADAEDAVMDLFEEVSQKIKQYEIQNFHTWLYTVAKNHCLQRIKKENKTFFVLCGEDIMENGSFFTLLDSGQSNEEEASALIVCMNELSVEQRKSIEYFYYQDKSYADIVSLTGFTLAKVKSYIQNGKRNLKNCVSRILKTLPDRDELHHVYAPKQ